jgi:acyl-CoA reductase-like NAD-dependent aldehyde dehydrogenase
MTETLKTISPVDGRIYVERPLETAAGIDRALSSAQRAQPAWGAMPLAARCEILGKAVDAFVAKAGDIAAEITWQMGRPISHAPGEVRGFEERARHMLSIAAHAFASAGMPPGVFQYLHLSHADTARLMGDKRIASVCFTGSVSGGRAVVAATASEFATSGLELGGKDPGYVRADANLAQAIDTLTDGAFFNAGQSCCGIKRIYVAAPRYEEFVAGVVDLTHKYRLGSPLDPQTTLGPVVRTSAADAVRSHVQEAVARGARQLIDETRFAASAPGTPYLAPQVLGDALETGTVFLNRCDYLDPSLAWTGVKNSGRGCTLSSVGFEGLTRPKSYHFRLPT